MLNESVVPGRVGRLHDEPWQLLDVWLRYDPDGDVLDVEFFVEDEDGNRPKSSDSRELDFFRHLRFDKDGRLLGVTVLAASQGIDLRGVPGASRIAAALALLAERLSNVTMETEEPAAADAG